ncbi:MAG TPA: gamma-glutamyl-phosphate reductase, partial [Planctomycetota bacterium]|nr:gamma-glutamyl-phosphate reductase [Planctomycetota bacterium]
MNDAASLHRHVAELCSRARPAARVIAGTSDQARARALTSAAQAIEEAAEAILAANAADLDQGRSDGLSPSMLDRLRLDGSRLSGVVKELRAVAALPDPVGRVLERRAIAQAIQLEKVTVPIGVIAIIFESRPNVTIDAAALCVRSGNACILRGGKEAVRSNRALAGAFRRGLEQAGVTVDAVQLVQEQDRALVPLLLARDD